MKESLKKCITTELRVFSRFFTNRLSLPNGLNSIPFMYWSDTECLVIIIVVLGLKLLGDKISHIGGNYE